VRQPQVSLGEGVSAVIMLNIGGLAILIAVVLSIIGFIKHNNDFSLGGFFVGYFGAILLVVSLVIHLNANWTIKQLRNDKVELAVYEVLIEEESAPKEIVIKYYEKAIDYNRTLTRHTRLSNIGIIKGLYPNGWEYEFDYIPFQEKGN
jgi:hypothetical protein